MLVFLLISLSGISSVDASWGSFFTGLTAYFSSSPAKIDSSHETTSNQVVSHSIDLVDWSIVKRDERISPKDKCFFDGQARAGR
jgi:hypothetical protein